MLNKNTKIAVLGSGGMVGSAIARALNIRGYKNLILMDHSSLELTSQSDVDLFFEKEQPEAVILAAAKVGGIMANSTAPGDFILENMLISTITIASAFKHNIKRLLFLGSSCIYPRDCPQPIKEEYLLSSPLEETNEGYAIAKISGLKMCELLNRQYGVDYISCMPTNLYGIGDNYDTFSGHVLPSLLRRFHEAKISGDKTVTIWGSGTPMREFLYVDDLAEAIVFLLENYHDAKTVNVGTGKDVSIKELGYLIKDVVGFNGEIEFDLSKPDGTPKKLLDVSYLSSLGWQYKTELIEGLKLTYSDFLKRYEKAEL